MARKPHPGAVKGDLSGTRQATQNGGEGRRRETWIELKPQSFHPDTRQIRIVGVKSLQGLGQAALELHPARRREHDEHFSDRNADQPETVDQAFRLACAERPVARESIQIEIVGRRVEQRGDCPLGSRDGVCFEPGQPFGRAAFTAGRPQIEKRPPPMVRCAEVSRTT